MKSFTTKPRWLIGLRFVLLFMAIVSLHSARAQGLISLYTTNNSTTTYTPITGGTLYGTTSSDDQRFVTTATPAGGTTNTGIGLPIGFNFTYNGYTFDRLAINNNGWISLGQSALGATAVSMATTSAYTPLSSTTSITPVQLRNRIAAFAGDLIAQTGASLRLQTIGTAPNRVCVIQWAGYARYSGGTVASENLNFQIRLNETTNTVQIVYGTMTINTATTLSHHMGLGGISNAAAELLGAGASQTNGNSLSFTSTSASLGWSTGGSNTAPS